MNNMKPRNNERRKDIMKGIILQRDDIKPAVISLFLPSTLQFGLKSQKFPLLQRNYLNRNAYRPNRYVQIIMAIDPLRLPSFDDDDTQTLHVIIDTPKGSRNKFKWDEKLGLYKLSGVLAAGAFFPYDFGFVPSTLADDGDPIDVLLLMEEPAFVGCPVPSRLLGGFSAQQTEKSTTERNDRLLAVAANSRNYGDIQALDDLNQNLIHEIEHFFVSYNAAKGKTFEPQGRFGSEDAHQLLEKACIAFSQRKDVNTIPRE